MSAAPFMQLYVADYLADTQHLTAEQHGAYLLLLMSMWRAGGRLPNDPKKLCRIAKVHAPHWAKMSYEVMEFFDVDGDDITQKRLVLEHEKAIQKSHLRSSAGRLGGIAKSLKDNKPPLANATVLPWHSSEPDTDIVKRDTNVSTKKSNGTRIPDGFEPDLRWAEENGLIPSQAIFEASQFKDYWTAKAGAAATKKDWPATWRTWVRNSVQRQASKPSYQKPKSQTPGDVMREMMNGSERQNPNGYLENNERPATINDIRLIPGTGWGG